MGHFSRSFLFISLIFPSLLTSCAPTYQQQSNFTIVQGTLVQEWDSIYRGTVLLEREGKPHCTGFLLNTRTVVTAAHCLMRPPTSLVFGSPQGLHERIALARWQIRAHEGFNRASVLGGGIPPSPWPESPINDIGVIALESDAPIWTQSFPIKESGSVNSGDLVVLAGFGRTGSPAELVGEMRKVDVRISRINERGQEIHFESGDGSTRGSCYGDSGGPMFAIESNGSLSVVGVTSRGIDSVSSCQGTGIYTDVRNFASWVNTTREELLMARGHNSETWFHRTFTAADREVGINLDFRLQPSDDGLKFRDLWVNVSSPAFTGQESVTISLGDMGPFNFRQKLEMKFENGRYTASPSAFLGRIARIKGTEIFYVLEVWVDGQPLIDSGRSSPSFALHF